MAQWNSSLDAEMDAIVQRGSWYYPGTTHARFEPLPEDAERFYDLVEMKAEHYWEEHKNAR